MSDENLLLANLVKEANSLEDKATRELWLDALQTFAKGGSSGLKALKEACTWRRKVVPIDEFIFGKAFLDLSKEEVFPAVMDACVNLDTDQYYEAVLTGALGIGKSTVANIMLARSLYKLSCMRSPQATMGLQRRTSIVFTIQSVRLNTAKKAVFEEFSRYIHHSPYFKQYYMYDRNVTSTMIFREQNVSILPVSSSTTGAISMNVLGGILDEMNFMQVITHSKSSNADIDGSFDQAKQMYNTISRRRKSRFQSQGKLPGIMFIISSSKFPTDFTERKAKEAKMRGGVDPGIFVWQHSAWSAKGREHFLPEDFKVMVGSSTVRSRVLENGEQPVPGHDVIDVPMDFYSDFVKDPDGAIRDFAGITTRTTLPFISRAETIGRAMESAHLAGYDNPFNLEEIDLSLGIPVPDRGKLRLDVNQPRAAHIDLGLKKDNCGLAVGHIAGYKLVSKVDNSKKVTNIEVLPIIAYDVIMRIRPPHRGEIEFSEVRKLLMYLRDKHNLPIKWVTYDGWNSVDSRQILKRMNFSTEYLSVEKPEGWNSLRDALYEERIFLLKHQWLAKELSELERRTRNNKEKIDHPMNGTKDVADAVCGVYTLLSTRKQSWPHYSSFVGGSTGTFLYGNPLKRQMPEHEVVPDFRAMPTGVGSMRMRKATVRRSIDRRSVSRSG